MSDIPSPPAGNLANIDEDGKVPMSRLATAEAARSKLSLLIQGDIPASVDRTKIQRNIDGAPPFTQDELDDAGQSNIANVNWGGARARIRDYLTAFHDIITSTGTLPSVKVTVGDIRQRSTWGQCISQRFHDLLFARYDDWKFIYEMHLHQKQMAIHGVGPCFRRERRDWRFHALKRRNILVDNDSPSDLSRIPVVFVRDTMYVTELYKFIRTKKERTNWNRTATIKAIANAQIKPNDQFNAEDAEQMWQDNAYDWSMNKSQVVKVAHAFVREFDDNGENGRVSHHIFTETTVNGYNPEGEDTGYLYSEVGALGSIGQAVWVCFQDVGNGDFESVRGLGLEAHLFGEMFNRLNNGLAENALQAGATVWQSDTPEHADKFTRIEIGPNRLVPTGLSMVQMNNGAGVQSQLAVSNHFSELESAGTGNFRTKATTSQNTARTATEVEAEVGQTSKLSNSSVSDYLIQLDDLLETTFRPATSATILPSDPGGAAALNMRRLLVEEDGLPEDMLQEIFDTAQVTVTRPIGNGSYADRISRLSRIGQFVVDMPDRKRKAYVRDSIAYIGGDRALADAYGPDLEQNEPGIEQTLAILENNGFMAGGSQDPFSPDNAHEVHFPIHLEFATQLLNGDPQRASQILGTPDQPGVLTTNMAEHVQALENDPTRKPAFDQFNKQLGAMQNAIKQVNAMADAAAQSQPQAQQPDPETMKAQATIQNTTQLTQAKIEQTTAKTQQHMAIKDATSAQNIRLAQEKAAQEAAKAAQDIAIKKQQAEADAAKKEPANAG